MTEPDFPRTLLPSRWRLPALAFTLTLAACLGGESVARAETVADVAGPANAVLARLEERKAALARAGASVVGVEVRALEDARSIATLGPRRAGSGVVIAADGLVLTIGYLILEADHVDLVDGSGRHLPARVVAYDLASGFGLLQALTPLPLEPVPLGISAAVKGDEPLLVASGGDEADLSLARMVSRRPFSGYWEYHIDGALFTAPARTDHSGAGLFNAEGELVGIGSLVVTDAAGNAAAPLRGNMFVPVDLLKPILGEMIATGRQKGSMRPWLGLSSIEDDGQLRVLRVSEGGPAESAGVEVGDIILAIGGHKVKKLEEFYRRLWSAGEPGVEVTLKLQQGGDVREVQIRSIDRFDLMRKRPTI